MNGALTQLKCYEGNNVAIHTTPLRSYFAMGGDWPRFVLSSTALWRGYVGRWKFAVEPQHLLERLTLEDVEMREIVTDPLQAAPELPFGHLHAAWKEFLKGQAEGCELWSFSAHWQTIWGRNELRSGYVLVENGAPGAYFLTVLKDLPNDTESDGNV